jgi:hypothetical protein
LGNARHTYWIAQFRQHDQDTIILWDSFAWFERSGASILVCDDSVL